MPPSCRDLKYAVLRKYSGIIYAGLRKKSTGQCGESGDRGSIRVCDRSEDFQIFNAVFPFALTLYPKTEGCFFAERTAQAVIAR